MKTVITATAPTGYQLNSLLAFGLGHTKNPNGSYTIEAEFNSEEEAREHLRTRARLYNDRTGGSNEELLEMLRDIEEGYLSLDAVTAGIQQRDE